MPIQIFELTRASGRIRSRRNRPGRTQREAPFALADDLRSGVSRSQLTRRYWRPVEAARLLRLTVSLESQLAIAVREAAVADEQNVSAWLADAARRHLANRNFVTSLRRGNTAPSALTSALPLCTRRRMTTLVLDAGALIALDRDDRSVWAMLRNAADDSAEVSVPAGVIARAWRDGKRQSILARALAHCDEVPLDGPLARAAGLLCGWAGSADIVDASVAGIAAARARGGAVALVTSDPNDLRHLLQTLSASVRLVTV